LAKCEVFTNLSDETNDFIQSKWTDMKSSDDETANPWLVPAFMAFCVLLSISILIYRFVKSKKDIF